MNAVDGTSREEQSDSGSYMMLMIGIKTQRNVDNNVQAFRRLS